MRSIMETLFDSKTLNMLLSTRVREAIVIIALDLIAEELYIESLLMITTTTQNIFTIQDLSAKIGGFSLKICFQMLR